MSNNSQNNQNNNTDLPWWDSRTVLKPRKYKSLRYSRNKAILKTPKTIYDFLDSKLYGCNEYKKALSTAIWSSINLKTKSSFLVIGPSGCGKTELARALSEIYFNSTIFDASLVSPRSYKGNNTISDCLLNVDTDNTTLPPWIFIDEIDKALNKPDLGDMIQNELLKMTEGGEIYVGKDDRDRKLIDTSRVNFVFLGTFAGIKKEHKNSIGFSFNEDEANVNSAITRDTLLDSNMLSNEFLGRINGGIIEVEPMDEQKASALLSDKRLSPIRRLEKQYKIDICVSDEKRKELVGLTSKYGVRGIYSELQQKINDAIFEDCTIQSITL
ncbi:MAG: AAA family ATPase [Lachnospiraceae bacterium]|nr:AAA family ATPase [Lachnospiraceae bacterium]